MLQMFSYNLISIVVEAFIYKPKSSTTITHSSTIYYQQENENMFKRLITLTTMNTARNDHF